LLGELVSALGSALRGDTLRTPSEAELALRVRALAQSRHVRKLLGLYVDIEADRLVGPWEITEGEAREAAEIAGFFVELMEPLHARHAEAAD
jgi:hypothetical protein